MLPPGLALSTSGALTGTPTVPANYHPRVAVTDNSGLTAAATLTIAVHPTNNTVWAWGSAMNGHWGTARVRWAPTDVPVQVSELTGVTEIAAGAFTGYALRSDGTVWGWGWGDGGELGNGGTTDSTVPVQVSGLTGVTDIAAGVFNGYALRADGTVWAWGAGYALGNGTIPGPNGFADSPVPVRCPG